MIQGLFEGLYEGIMFIIFVCLGCFAAYIFEYGIFYLYCKVRFNKNLSMGEFNRFIKEITRFYEE